MAVRVEARECRAGFRPDTENELGIRRRCAENELARLFAQFAVHDPSRGSGVSRQRDRTGRRCSRVDTKRLEETASRRYANLWRLGGINRANLGDHGLGTGRPAHSSRRRQGCGEDKHSETLHPGLPIVRHGIAGDQRIRSTRQTAVARFCPAVELTKECIGSATGPTYFPHGARFKINSPARRAASHCHSAAEPERSNPVISFRICCERLVMVVILGEREDKVVAGPRSLFRIIRCGVTANPYLASVQLDKELT